MCCFYGQSRHNRICKDIRDVFEYLGTSYPAPVDRPRIRGCSVCTLLTLETSKQHSDENPRFWHRNLHISLRKHRYVCVTYICTYILARVGTLAGTYRKDTGHRELFPLSINKSTSEYGREVIDKSTSRAQIF